MAGGIDGICVLALSIVAVLTASPMSPTAFSLFGAATVLLGHRWILVDMRKAFERAVAQHHVVLAGCPPHLMQISRTFPGRWLAMLYVRLHPELIDEGPDQRATR